MSRNLRGRLDRLDRLAGEGDAADTPRVTAWDGVLFLTYPERLDPEHRARVQASMDESEAARVRALEDSTGKAYRRELARQGLPQPATLAGIDPFDELLRLSE